jgi:hypothetical protein
MDSVANAWERKARRVRDADSWLGEVAFWVERLASKKALHAFLAKKERSDLAWMVEVCDANGWGLLEVLVAAVRTISWSILVRVFSLLVPKICSNSSVHSGGSVKEVRARSGSLSSNAKPYFSSSPST